MVVGRVDCTKNSAICEEFNVKGYPAIMFIKQKKRIQYQGEREVAEIVDFAERLTAPNLVIIDDCRHLTSSINIRGRILLSTIANGSSLLHSQFKSLASQPRLKANWWFYHMPKAKCKGLIEDHGIFMLKRDLKRAIKFKLEELDSSSQNDLKKSLLSWIARESFPVYGPFNTRNYEAALATGKLLVIAVLDEYKPAKRLTEPSRKFESSFEVFAKRTAQIDDEIIFFWCSEVDLIYSIAIGQVVVPNVMLLKSDYSFSLLLNTPKDLEVMETGVPAKLHDRSIKLHIAAARIDELNFGGGNTIPFKIARTLYIQYCNFVNIFRAEPLLATILLICPTSILIFVIINTCYYEKIYGIGPNMDDEDNEDEDNLVNEDGHQRQNHQHHHYHNRRAGKNHIKQE